MLIILGLTEFSTTKMLASSLAHEVIIEHEYQARTDKEKGFNFNYVGKTTRNIINLTWLILVVTLVVP